jgi:hypothetical protein
MIYVLGGDSKWWQWTGGTKRRLDDSRFKWAWQPLPPERDEQFPLHTASQIIDSSRPRGVDQSVPAARLLAQRVHRPLMGGLPDCVEDGCTIYVTRHRTAA